MGIWVHSGRVDIPGQRLVSRAWCHQPAAHHRKSKCLSNLYQYELNTLILPVCWQSLGTDDLVDYVLKYDLYFNTSSIARPIAKVPWEKRVNATDPSSVEYAPHDAVDLLGRLLV